MAGEKLAALMLQAAASQMARQTPTDFVYGMVTDISPLVVQLENKFPIREDSLILSALCKSFVTTLLRHSHRCEGCGSETDICLDPVTVWRGLEKGDRVRMLQCDKGQKFYVLDREGSLP